MKQWILDLICRWFGHKEFDEVYCVKSPPLISWYRKRGWKQQIAKVRYDVVKDIVCARCGRIHRIILRHRISRAQMLHDGWFIIDE